MRVLLHGFMGDPSVWDFLVQQGDFAPALFGHAPCAEDIHITTFEDEVARLVREIEARQHGPVHLIGYSLGARLALGIAATMKVDRLTLISGRDGLASETERAQRIADDEAWAQRFEACRDARDFKNLLALWDAQPVFNTRAKGALEGRLQHNPERLASSLRALSLGQMPVYADRVRCDRIEIICGYEDAKFRALGESLASKLRARFKAIPGAGHDLPREAPDALKHLILHGELQ